MSSTAHVQNRENEEVIENSSSFHGNGPSPMFTASPQRLSLVLCVGHSPKAASFPRAVVK